MFTSNHNAAKDANAANMNVPDGLRKIGAGFLSSREVKFTKTCVSLYAGTMAEKDFSSNSVSYHRFTR